jgi:hypothetical protein
MGLILAGKNVEVPGFEIQNFVENPKLRLAPGDVRWRTPRERHWVHLIVYHTTGGIPGGSNLTPQVIKPGLGKSSNGGERVVASWTHDVKRPGGAQIIIDFDGKIYCCADLLVEAAYHAGLANGCSVGIEVVQGRDAVLYAEQLAIAARFGVTLCRLMPVPIQCQIPAKYRGPISRFVTSQQKDIPLSDVVGLIGHRDLTSNRGEGDPGDAMMEALAEVGCEKFDFDLYEDILTWKQRQAILGVAYLDGLPGPNTVELLRKNGHPDGIWRKVNV